jgi:hypothetical protein
MYWMSLGVSGTTDGKAPRPWTGGAIYKCDLAGCQTSGPNEVLTGRETHPFFANPVPFTIRNHGVFWADTAGLNRCTAEDCSGTIETASSIHPVKFEITDSQVFWTDDAEIARCPLSDFGSASKVWSESGFAGALVADHTSVYWGTGGPTNLRTCPQLGCTEGSVLISPTSETHLIEIKALAVDDDSIYIADGVGSVYRCAKNDCDGTLAMLAQAQSGHQPTEIASDGIAVYWIERSGRTGAVRKCSVKGCEDSPTTIASDVLGPMALVLDGASVYWVEFGSGTGLNDGRIWRAPK